MENHKSNRLKDYDYSRDGWYFFTICTKDKKHYFGNIKNGLMKYNGYGDIILKHWQAIRDYYKGVFLDQWILVLNHIHGIIFIESRAETGGGNGMTGRCPVPAIVAELNDIRKIVGTKHCSAPWWQKLWFIV